MAATEKRWYSWHKMLIILGVISILSGLIGYYFKAQYQQLLLTEQQKVNHVATNIELFFNGRLMALQMLAATDDVKSMNPSKLEANFRQAQSLMGFANIALFDSHSSLIYSVSQGIPVKNLHSEQSSFQQALDGYPTISNRIMMQSAQAAYIYVEVPVYNEKGNVQGVLAAGVPIQALADLIQIKEEANGSYYFMIDSSAQFIEHPRLNDVLSAESGIRSFTLHNYFSSNSGYVVVRSVLDSINKLYVFQALDKTQWRVVHAMPLSVVYTQIFKTSLADILSFLFLIATIILLYWLLMQEKKHQQDLEKLRWERLSSVNQLAAGLAHEIRNPITSIKGFIQLMMRRPDKPPGEEKLQIIIDEAERIEQLIGEFQMLAKPLREPERTVIDIGKMLRSVATLMEGQASGKGAAIQLNIKRECNVLGDVAQLKQVWINLLRNAIDAVEPHEGIIQISLQVKERWVRIHIQDNGVGIAKENIPKLATPFFTTKDGGTGLGLSICYSIVGNHGGQIKVSSQEQKGTTFSVYLPKID